VLEFVKIRKTDTLPFKVLEEEMTVYKIGEWIHDGDIFESRYMKFPYLDGGGYATEIKTKLINGRTISITEGFHAYVDKELAEMFANKVYKGTHKTLVEFQIPAGAQVLFDSMGKTVVTNKIELNNKQ